MNNRFRVTRGHEGFEIHDERGMLCDGMGSREVELVLAALEAFDAKPTGDAAAAELARWMDNELSLGPRTHGHENRLYEMVKRALPYVEAFASPAPVERREEEEG